MSAVPHEWAVAVHRAMQDAPHDGADFRQARAAIRAVLDLSTAPELEALLRGEFFGNDGLVTSCGNTGYDKCWTKEKHDGPCRRHRIRAVLKRIDEARKAGG